MTAAVMIHKNLYISMQFWIYGSIKYKTRELKYLWAYMDRTYTKREREKECLRDLRTLFQ